MSDTNQFELEPGAKKVGENSGAVERATEWATAMAGMPEKSFMDVIKTGEKVGEATFGNANEENEFYGESKDDGGEEQSGQGNEMGDTKKTMSEVLSDAVSKYGYGRTMQKLSECDVSGSNDPVGDLYYYMGLGTTHEGEEEAKHEVGMTDGEADNKEIVSSDQDVQGVRTEINNMKKIINEVKGANPVYEGLRQGAWAAGMDVFEYAAKAYEVQSLPELFQVLEQQREQSNEVEEKQKEQEEEKKQATTQDGNERLNPGITYPNAA